MAIGGIERPAQTASYCHVVTSKNWKRIDGRKHEFCQSHKLQYQESPAVLPDHRDILDIEEDNEHESTKDDPDYQPLAEVLPIAFPEALPN